MVLPIHFMSKCRRELFGTDSYIVGILTVTVVVYVLNIHLFVFIVFMTESIHWFDKPSDDVTR